ncbi:MAG TPA: DNA-binding protein YbiB [Telluria sp.]|nr:DNA-binding protein YbiB [Telluria sp.]
MNHEHFPAARFIKEIGRGVKGARSLTREDAHDLYAAMLDGRVSDLELGGIMLAMRIKGESADELEGFLAAAEESFEPLPAPEGDLAPVLIPSYNGARKLPNLTPLLAALLARHGVPVLVHGVSTDPGRVTTFEIMAAMGLCAAADVGAVRDAWSLGQPAFMPIAALSPKLARLLAMRSVLGVRNSTHTLVKIFQPFDGPALRLVSYTHPEYLITLGELFARPDVAARGDAFLMRGTEGETVANSNRGQQIDWFRRGERTVLVERDPPTDDVANLPESREAVATAAWIARVLEGQVPVPTPIAQQVEEILMASRDIAER